MSHHSSDDDDDCCPDLVSATVPLMPDENITNQLTQRAKEFEIKQRQFQQQQQQTESSPTSEDHAVVAKAIVNEEHDQKTALQSHPPVPLVILSGFLGSGKTTLIQYVLSVNHGMKIAVIVNEFEFGRSIEKGLTVRSAEASADEWVELRNGCMCCSAKSQSVQALEQLVAKRGGQLDAILVETAGLADPVPIARSFWLDDALQAKVRLAGIVVVVDALNIEGYIKSDPLLLVGKQQQNKFVEAARQLLAADRVVLNKIDLCGENRFAFLDEQDKIDEYFFADSSPERNEKNDILTKAAKTIREVNPVAPMTLTCLRTLLQVDDAEPSKVSVQTLKKLLLLSNQKADHQPSSKWTQQTSVHQHTAEMTSKQIQILDRVFASVRDVDFCFAAILDNSIDGQDEDDEAIPAQLRARERGSVVVRSKSAVWVKNPEFIDRNKNNNNSDEEKQLEYLAYQVQSIGSTFEVVPMVGLNTKLLQEKRQHQQQITNDDKEDSAEPDRNENDDDEILKVGMSRMLFLGFGLREEEIVKEFMTRTVKME